MDLKRFDELAARYAGATVVVAGDFCLDRYLEIDPALEELSLETGLPAQQVVRVRPQPGGAGNVLANVAALRPRELRAVGICGEDGEGFELLRALRQLGAKLDWFVQTPQRRTFTYTKPLVLRPEGPPRELARLDIRSRGPINEMLAQELAWRLRDAAKGADVLICMEQVADGVSGFFHASMREAARPPGATKGQVAMLDSRADPTKFAGLDLKVNQDEACRLSGQQDVTLAATTLARQIGRMVFVTLGADGMLAADPKGKVRRAAGVKVAPPIDVVGAGDAVLAHLALARHAGATPQEAMELANLAGTVVVKKIGTTGTASLAELRAALTGRLVKALP